MDQDIIIERLFQALITGDRESTRLIVTETRQMGMSAEEMTQDVYWPVLEMVNQLHRADQLTNLAQHYAIRLLRALVDQAQAEYMQKDRCGRKVLMFSGHCEMDELSGQLVADLVEAGGYEVYFGGGNIANDEILAEVGEQRPEVLLMFASSPGDAPNIRKLIDTIRTIGACPYMQIVVGGGVFNRADGLAQEIGADLWAKNPTELLLKLDTENDRRAAPDQRTVGRNRRTQRTNVA